jgi:hypothetical protein
VDTRTDVNPLDRKQKPEVIREAVFFAEVVHVELKGHGLT